MKIISFHTTFNNFNLEIIKKKINLQFYTIMKLKIFVCLFVYYLHSISKKKKQQTFNQYLSYIQKEKRRKQNKTQKKML